MFLAKLAKKTIHKTLRNTSIYGATPDYVKSLET